MRAWVFLRRIGSLFPDEKVVYSMMLVGFMMQSIIQISDIW